MRHSTQAQSVSAAFQGGILLNSIRDLLYIVFRHKWKILTCFLFIAAAVTGVTFALPTVYESEARLLIRIGRENLPSDASIQGALLNVTQDRTNEVNSELSILSSRYLAEQVVDAVGEGWILHRPDLRCVDLPLEPMGAPSFAGKMLGRAVDMAKDILARLKLREPLDARQEAIEEVMESLQVEAEAETNIVRVTYESKDPRLAQIILKEFVSSYRVRHIEVFATKTSPEFFQTQADALHEELAQREQELEAFRKTHAISDIDTQKQTLLAQISEIEAQLSNTAAEMQGMQAKVGALQERVSSRKETHELSRTTGLPNEAVNTIKEKLLDLRIREADLTARYAEDYRPLVDLREQIAGLEAERAREKPTLTSVTTGLDEGKQVLEQEYDLESVNFSAGLARLDKLEQALAAQRDALALLSAQEMDLKRLIRNRDLAEQDYREYRKNLQQAKIAKALEMDEVSNVSEVQPASLPLTPVRPHKVQNLLLGMLLGCFGGIVLAFACEFFDDSLNSTVAVQRRLGVPVLASISESEIEKCI